MSDILEKAVIDANALKEVAVKNAEALVVEKYSQKIKEAVEQLLEQDEEELPGEGLEDIGGEEDMGMDMGAGLEGGDMLGATGGEESAIADQIPMAATDAVELGGTPGEEEEIEIDFSELEKQLSGEKDADMGDMVDRGEIASELPSETEEVSPVETEVPGGEDMSGLEDIDDQTLQEIIEALEIDYEPKLDGWLGSSKVEREEASDGLIALATSDEATKEELERVKKESETFQNENKKLSQKKDKLEKENKELKESMKKLIKRLNESNVANAKFLYTNRVLSSSSLNERQKKLFVEQISKSDSVDSAKMVYETLLSSSGVVKSKSAPKSLTEVVSKTSMTFPFKPNSEKVVPDPFMDRMKTLAGIKK